MELDVNVDREHVTANCEVEPCASKNPCVAVIVLESMEMVFCDPLRLPRITAVPVPERVTEDANRRDSPVTAANAKLFPDALRNELPLIDTNGFVLAPPTKTKPRAVPLQVHCEDPNTRTDTALVGPARYTLAVPAAEVPLVNRDAPEMVKPRLDTVNALEETKKLWNVAAVNVAALVIVTCTRSSAPVACTFELALLVSVAPETVSDESCNVPENWMVVPVDDNDVPLARTDSPIIETVEPNKRQLPPLVTVKLL